MESARTKESLIVDVVNHVYTDTETGISSPLVKQLVRNTVHRWKEKHEASINRRIKKVKSTRKRNRLENINMADNFPENRQVALDVLAVEWLEDNPATLDVKTYLIDKLIPCLIMGLEKLLTEVEKRDLVISETCSEFNPVNYLAQYLMRNNPKYSNFPEASPYAKSLRKVAEDLRGHVFAIMDAQLARERMKAEIQRKRLEREKMERLKDDEQSRRKAFFEDLFVEWAQNEGVLPLAVVSIF